jgi:hypothetical protein
MCPSGKETVISSSMLARTSMSASSKTIRCRRHQGIDLAQTATHLEFFQAKHGQFGPRVLETVVDLVLGGGRAPLGLEVLDLPGLEAGLLQGVYRIGGQGCGNQHDERVSRFGELEGLGEDEAAGQIGGVGQEGGPDLVGGFEDLRGRTRIGSIGDGGHGEGHSWRDHARSRMALRLISDHGGYAQAV